MVPCTTNKTKQRREVQKEMYVPMKVVHDSRSMPEDEGWEDVDKVSKRVDVLELLDDGATSPEIVGAERHCKRRRRKQGDYAKEKSKTTLGAGKEGAGKSGGPKGGPAGEPESWRYQGERWTCGRVGQKSANCRWESCWRG